MTIVFFGLPVLLQLRRAVRRRSRRTTRTSPSTSRRGSTASCPCTSSSSRSGGLCGACGIIGAYQTKNGLPSFFALSRKSKTGCSPSRPILRPVVAVAAALRRVAVRHALGEPAAPAGVPLPPLPGLEADVALPSPAASAASATSRTARSSPAAASRKPASLFACALVSPFGQRRVVGGDLVLVRVEPGDHRREARAAQAARHVAALEDAALSAASLSRCGVLMCSWPMKP